MRTRILMAAAIAAGVLLPIVGVSGVANAATVTHSSTASHSYKTYDPVCIISPKPRSFVETGLAGAASSVAFAFVIECEPEFGGTTVTVTAQQLSNACHDTLSWYSSTAATNFVPGPSFTTTLDNDGTANVVVWGGPGCAPSTSLVTVDMNAPPYATATTWITVKPPVTTKPGLQVFPTNQVEDSTTSSVNPIFYAEFPSVYAEQQVVFSDPQLSARCTGGITWVGADEVVLGTGPSVTTTLDDNGNAFVVALAGPSCATGNTLGQVDLVPAPGTTYTHTFNILSPRPTNP